MSNLVQALRTVSSMLNPQEQQLLANQITPDFVSQLSQSNPEAGDYLRTFEAPDYTSPQSAPQQSNVGFANGGLIERGQIAEDPTAAPMGVNPGKADDLKRNVSEGEFVVPKDVVDSKGEEFFQKLITSTREAKAKMAEEKAAVQAAQEGQGQQVPIQPQPAPPSNVQPGMTGMLTLPQGVGAARRPLI